jgi:hypothetical protein
MDLRDRLAGINANLDDLQAGIEGSARAADGVSSAAAAINGTAPSQLGSDDLMKSLTHHAREAESCANHQRGVLRELRQNFARLQREVNGFKRDG